MCMLLSKLPGGTRDKWSRKVLTIRRNGNREPMMTDFIKFVEDEALMVNDPIFSKKAVEQHIEKVSSATRKGRISSFATGSGSEIPSNERLSSSCIYCSNRDHKLERCTDLMDKVLKERIRFLARKKLCYGCLTPMSDGHNASSCKHRMTCTKCNGNHPTLLHGYIPKSKLGKDEEARGKIEKDAIKSNFAGFCNITSVSTKGSSSAKIISMCIVPVKIKREGIDKEILTYAMLDNCSQGSFIHDVLLEQLGANGIKTTLNLKTLNGERSENTLAIEGLKVCGVNGDGSWLKLPKLYSRAELPVDKEEIATPDNISKWEHLEVVSKEIAQVDTIPVGILVGANCIKALEPTQVISSKAGGPYAYKTRLGWCIVGPINDSAVKNPVKCNRIAVKDVTTSAVASHHFEIEREVKEITLEECFKECTRIISSTQKVLRKII